ncbi:SpoIIE family protein phosphatase, partial [bacterium]|nr:SpoIIE family protein phosphatase [bacterium]
LVVDDEKSITYLLSEVLRKNGHSVRELSDGKFVPAELEKGEYDLVVSDLHMKDKGGIDVLKSVKDHDNRTEVLILTGHGTVATAVEAMKLGAFEYLTKPIDMEEFRLKVEKALERRDFKLQIEKQQQELVEYRDMIRKDLDLAGQVQHSLVPAPLNLPNLEVYPKYLPMIGVGGDFADVYYDGSENVYLTLVDVTGHGITAALLVNRISSEIRNLIRDEMQPKSILYEVNNFILQAFEGMAMFLTMFSAVINLRKGSFTYAGSAHPAVILWKSRENKFLKLESENVIIGYEKRDEDKFVQDVVMMGQEDKIVMYTDGITEAEDAQGKQLGINGFINFFRSSVFLPANEIIEIILNGINEFTPNPLKDDVYLIVAGIK